MIFAIANIILVSIITLGGASYSTEGQRRLSLLDILAGKLLGTKHPQMESFSI